MRALLLVLLVGCETGDPPDYSAKLTARYPMDDLVAGKASDISGNNHHGMCTTCPGVEAGKSISAFRFDGGDQEVHVEPNPAFDGVVRGFSAAAWVKVDIAPPTIPGCAMVKGAMWSLCVTPDLKAAFGSFMAGAITVGTWHHIAISYDGETKRIVVDGTEAGTQPGTVMSEASGLLIGAELMGAVDEAHVFDGVLTDEEIADLVTP